MGYSEDTGDMHDTDEDDQDDDLLFKNHWEGVCKERKNYDDEAI